MKEVFDHENEEACSTCPVRRFRAWRAHRLRRFVLLRFCPGCGLRVRFRFRFRGFAERSQHRADPADGARFSGRDPHGHRSRAGGQRGGIRRKSECRLPERPGRHQHHQHHLPAVCGQQGGRHCGYRNSGRAGRGHRGGRHRYSRDLQRRDGPCRRRPCGKPGGARGKHHGYLRRDPR